MTPEPPSPDSAGRATWRTRAGLVLTVLGGVVLIWSLGRTPPPPPPVAGGYVLRLNLGGRSLAAIPLGPEAMSAVVWLQWLALPLLPLLVGAFFLFLDTSPGARLEAALLDWFRRQEGD